MNGNRESLIRIRLARARFNKKKKKKSDRPARKSARKKRGYLENGITYFRKFEFDEVMGNISEEEITMLVILGADKIIFYFVTYFLSRTLSLSK